MALNKEDLKAAFDQKRVLSDARRSTFARRAPNHFFGIVASLLIIAGCLAVFAFLLATRSAFGRNGEEEVQGISAEVGLYRNEYGIVHITAANDTDAYFGIGYAHAQDRLWQMDFLRRVGRGRLSEIFGRRALEQDIFLRAMRFDSLATALARHISPESRAALQGYANGINAYLETHKGKIAAEFDALEYEPEPWRVEDCLLLLRLWAWELNSGFTADLVISAIADTIGRERALQLLPAVEQDPYYAPSVLDSLVPKRLQANTLHSPSVLDSLRNNLLRPDSLRKSSSTVSLPSHFAPNPAKRTELSIPSASAAPHSLLHLVRNTRHLAAMHGSSLGSNAWAVRSSSFFHPALDSIGNSAPSKHRHGAILAADAHLALTLPARWYEAHLSTPTLNVLGHTLPGLPFVIVGRNDRVAWSLVNAMIDDTDFFAERIDSNDMRRYMVANQDGSLRTEKFRLITDTIKVKDSSDAVVDLRFTGRSCVISDLPIGLQQNYPGLQNAIAWKSRLNTAVILHSIADSVNASTQDAFRQVLQRRCLTFRWTGQEMSDETLALLRLAKARSFDEVQAGMETFSVPAVNCVVASGDGAVGLFPVGLVPLRNVSNQAHPNIIRQGWERSEDWRGFARLSDVGSLFNPPSGRIIAANNPITRTPLIDGESVHLSHLWDMPARAARISEYLSDFEYFSVTGMKAAQTDLVSHYAQRMIPFILQAFEQTTNAQIMTQGSATFAPNQTSKPFKLSFEERKALRLVTDWNGALESTSAAASFYTAFLERYTHNTLADDLGEALYAQYCMNTRLPLRAMFFLTERYKAEDSLSATWFDKRSTAGIETRNDIIRQSFIEAVSVVRKTINTASDNFSGNAEADIDSVEGWNYGRLHTLTMRHILANGAEWTRLPMRGVVNMPTIEYGGDATTISTGEWSFNAPFRVMAGASMRFVCDMSDTLAYMILPSGNTGEIMTRNYSDQREFWRNGGLLAVSTAREPHASFNKILRLIPKS